MTSSFDWFRGDGGQAPERAALLPRPLSFSLRDPGRYLVDEGLRDACNVALLLGQPLLLTGEPGTGKSRFAHALAWEFGLGEPLLFAVKSTSTARGLFYHYDGLKRFQDIQSGIDQQQAPATNYLQFSALGQAILNSLEPADVPEPLRGKRAAGSEPARRSVVLLDEIDKAPRDFPNDLLSELDSLSFEMPELNALTLRANPDLLPLMVLTSNSERDLPDAFLRRCVYYHISFPTPDKLAEIVALQLRDFPADSQLVDEAIGLFVRLREHGGWTKKPATAELLLWLLTLRQLLGEGAFARGLRGAASPQLLQRSLSSLVKTSADRGAAEAIIRQWWGGDG